MTRKVAAFCECGHAEDLHDGRCLVELPPFFEEELPAWRCPCRGYAWVLGPWLWHPATQSWAARGPRTAEPAA